MDRKRKIEEVRVEDKANRDRLEQKKLELKIATEQRLAASDLAKREQAVAKLKGEQEKSARLLASLEAKANAKKEESKAKAAKEKAKADIQKTEKEKEELRRTFAGKLAAAMVRFMKKPSSIGCGEKSSKVGAHEPRKDALLEVVKKKDGKISWKKVGAAPEFWSAADKRGSTCISAKDNFMKNKEPVIYASNDFSWEMWNHRTPQGPSVNQFRKFVEFVMPGYNKAIAPRYPVEELLRLPRTMRTMPSWWRSGFILRWCQSISSHVAFGIGLRKIPMWPSELLRLALGLQRVLPRHPHPKPPPPRRRRPPPPPPPPPPASSLNLPWGAS